MKITNEKLRRAIEKLSEETIVSALEAYGIDLGLPKPKFEPIEIHAGCFVVSVEKGKIIIKTGCDYIHNGCRSGSYTAREFIAALQSAIDFIERNKL